MYVLYIHKALFDYFSGRLATFQPKWMGMCLEGLISIV